MSLSEELENLSKHVIKYGLSLGADQVEVYIVTGVTKAIQIELGSIHKFTETSDSGIGVRVIKNKAIGMSSTTIFTIESIEQTVKNAYSLAKVSTPDSNFNSLPEDTTPTPTIADTFDKNIIELPVEDFTQIMLESINEAKVEENAIISGNFSAGSGERYIVNSQGIERHSVRTSINGYLSVKIQKGDDIGNSYYFDSSPLLRNFEHIKIGKEAGKRAKRMLGSQKIETKDLPILMDPETTYFTVSNILSRGINAFNVINKTAFFIDKIGDKIASELLSIKDNPFYPGGTGSAAFDDEGVVPREVSLVKDGILQTYITDSYTAPLVGLKNTAHASRDSFSSRPRPSLYSLEIKAGDTPKDSIQEDMKEGILLIGSPIPSMGNNPQISAQINQGFYIKDGEIKHPVKNTVIGCTVFELYEKIAVLSKETENRKGHISPWILLEALRISGGK
ncbi:MAG: TldD/PmbA family protein [Candidatus Heimdallarchaeaceae archaeon]